MKKPNRKSLTVSFETIRKLDDDKLVNINGGFAPKTSITTTCYFTCRSIEC